MLGTFVSFVYFVVHILTSVTLSWHSFRAVDTILHDAVDDGRRPRGTKLTNHDVQPSTQKRDWAMVAFSFVPADVQRSVRKIRLPEGVSLPLIVVVSGCPNAPRLHRPNGVRSITSAHSSQNLGPD